MNRMQENARRACAAAILVLCTTTAMAAVQDQASAPPQDSKREQMNKEVDEAVEAIRAYSIEQRDEAAKRALASMEELDRRISALQVDIDQQRAQMGDAARRESQVAMADLRARRQELSKWYDRMRHSSGKAWSEVKGGFTDSYRALAEALRKARLEFDRGTPSQEKGEEKDGATSALRIQRLACKRLA